MSLDAAEVFLRVFEDVRFPFMAADLELLGEALAGPGHRSWLKIPLPSDTAKRPMVAASLRGLLRNLDVPPQVAAVMAQAGSIVRSGTEQAMTEMALARRRFSIFEHNGCMVWEEDGLWPVAYSTLFKQLGGLLELFAFAMAQEQSMTSSAIALRISEFPRQMPTEIHYALASLGAWLGAPTNFQFFSYYATRPQLLNSETNIQYAKLIGYDEISAQALDKSGIVALPATLVLTLLQAQGPLPVPILGSLPIDEFNLVNLPSGLPSPTGPDAALPGFILDKHYRTTYSARTLQDHGLLGASTVFRDHYADFYREREPVALLRCKHYSVPVFEVSSTEEIQSLVSRIPERDKNGLFFRGQTSFYEVRREEAVKRLLFSGSCSVEPSLVTSAARSGFDYDELHFALRHFVEERVFSVPVAQGAKTREDWRKSAASPMCELDYAVMALAQHYGFPSHGLDVTLSSDVATWFATNKFARDSVGRSSYNTLVPGDWPANSSLWPVVFACQMVTTSTRQSLHDCHELAGFGVRARRPIAQEAMFFLGGHSDHQNRLAECVVCAFRLRPGSYATAATFDSLFPKPEDDPAYALILDFAVAPPFQSFAHFANRFHK